MLGCLREPPYRPQSRLRDGQSHACSNRDPAGRDQEQEDAHPVQRSVDLAHIAGDLQGIAGRGHERADAHVAAADFCVTEEGRAAVARSLEHFLGHRQRGVLVERPQHGSVGLHHLCVGDRREGRAGDIEIRLPIRPGALVQRGVSDLLCARLKGLVGLTPQLVAHDHEDHGGRNDDGEPDGGRCHEREAYPKAHASRSGVADAAHRVDQPRLAAGLGLAPQVADVDVERVRGEAEVVAPDALEDDRPRQHLARVEQEQLEQRELGARQLDPLLSARDLARARVELEVGEAERVAARAVVAGTTQQRPHARQQLLERERLGQVVVGAGVEPFDPVLDLRARGQHQHRQPASPGRAACGRPRARPSRA